MLSEHSIRSFDDLQRLLHGDSVGKSDSELWPLWVLKESWRVRAVAPLLFDIRELRAYEHPREGLATPTRAGWSGQTG